MNDTVVPPAMTDFVGRVVPNAIVHKLPEEGHLSYFCLCDECHRKIFSTIFGSLEGPLVTVDNTLTKDDVKEASDQAQLSVV